jgi:hypothetical protein
MHGSKNGPRLMAVAIGVIVLSSGTVAAQEDGGPRQVWPDVLAPATSLLSAEEEGEFYRPGLEPALAGGMSLLLPGGGQFYNGQNVKGGLMLAGLAASVVYAFTAGLNHREFCAGEGMTRVCQTQSHWPNSRFWIGLGSAAGVQAWSVLDAIAVANRRAARAGELGVRLELGPHLRDGEPAVAAGLRLTR